MALFTIADLLNEIQDEIVGKPQAKIVRAVNKVLTRLYNEPELIIRGTFVTQPSVTTGTVAVTQDSTTATFSSAVLSTTDPFDLVQIEGENAWHSLTPTSTTAGTLSSAWAQATNATATYTLVRPAIAFPSAVGRILEIGQPGLAPLVYRTTEFEEGIGSQTRSGTPTSWMPYKYDDSAATPNDDKYRIVLVPFPAERQTYVYTAKPRPTRLAIAAATSATIPMSDVWYEAIVEGTLFHCWKQEDKDGAKAQFALYEAAVRRIRSSLMPWARIRPRMRQQARMPRFTVSGP